MNILTVISPVTADATQCKRTWEEEKVQKKIWQTNAFVFGE